MRIRADGPSAQRSGLGEARTIESTVVAGLAALAIVLPGRAGCVHEKQSVVYCFSGAGPKLDSFHPLALGDIHRDGEVAIDVGAGGGKLERRRHGEDKVGFAELPTVG